MKTLSNLSVLVLGLGESGLAMARWCAYCGARVLVADSRQEPPGINVLRDSCPDIAVRTGEFEVSLLDGVELVAVSPGLDFHGFLPAEARRRGIPVLGELSLFAQALIDLDARRDTRILAITGTNGKTTTTALTAALVKACGLDAVAAGNISPAVLDVLRTRCESGKSLPDCWVLELSSFQLESMEGLAPDAATVLNVSDDHLDRHGDMVNYAQIKSRIFDGCAVQVLNRDDERVAAMARPGGHVISFGAETAPTDNDYGLLALDGRNSLYRGSRCLIDAAELPLQGTHNALNALAALALCEAIGCQLTPLLDALRSFKGLPHRMALVACRADGVRYYNDSKGTNVGATVAAMLGIQAPVVLIAGGDGKGQDFSPLRVAIQGRARGVVLIGRDADRVANALSGVEVLIKRCETLQQAVVEADALALAGDAVVLSPACASLDMFRNYADRGDQFATAVRDLPEVRAV